MREIDHVAETGNLDRFVKIHSGDEIGIMAESFNRMIETLDNTQQYLMSTQRELREHQGNLEGLVKERTQELAIAMEKAEESDRLKSAFLAIMSAVAPRSWTGTEAF
jgi:methyl-accepting chemotaxis protein